ncbi:MAG: hypothetical protein ACK5FV_01405 [Bacteroidota bacterium]
MIVFHALYQKKEAKIGVECESDPEICRLFVARQVFQLFLVPGIMVADEELENIFFILPENISFHIIRFSGIENILCGEE